MAVRSRWVALGASLAMVLGAGGVLTSAAGSTVSSFVPIAPCRLFDTRAGSDNVGPRATPLGAGETYVSAVWGENGECSIPTGATGVTMNVAIVNPTAPSFLTVFPADAARPLAANLNWVAGQTPTPNAVTAALSADGKLAFYNLAGAVELAVDVNGYYVAATAGPAGPQGPAGPTGATGATGATGSAGPRGFSAWDTIPSGVTVTGVEIFYENALASTWNLRLVQLPALTPTPLAYDTVNFAADAASWTTDDDPACSGSVDAPTAPPGKVCLYPWLRYDTGTYSAGAPEHGANSAFRISWYQPAAGVVGLQFTWAYTAP